MDTNATRSESIKARVEPDLRQAIEQLAMGNGLGTSETMRLVIRRGIRAVVEDGQRGPIVPRLQPLDTLAFVERYTFILETLANC